MRLPSGLVHARIKRRLNRFAVEVEFGGRSATVHMANSGRARGLLEPGTPALLIPRHSPGRKASFDLALVHADGVWVSADARLPNGLVREALAEGRIERLAGYSDVQAEARHGGSRFDFLLEGPGGACLVEAKSVTLVQDGIGLFPDAPTPRGMRHVRELAQVARGGMAGCVLFVVQRPDDDALAPNDDDDPAFGRALREAAEAGVAVLAYRCDVRVEVGLSVFGDAGLSAEVRISDTIPVRL